MSTEGSVIEHLDNKMLVALVVATSVLFVVIIVILCCYCRKYRKKEIEKFEYSEDSDKQPFVEQSDSLQPDGENRDLESGSMPRDFTMTSIVSFDEKNISKTTEVSPIKRIKSYTIGGCSPKLLAGDAMKKNRSTSDENDELQAAQLDSLQLESCIYDSFTKLKDIYDYQSSRYVEKKKTHSTVETDDENVDCSPITEVKVLETDESFDRVKDLYDRVSRSMLLERQHSLSNSNGNVCTMVSNSNNNHTENISPVFI